MGSERLVKISEMAALHGVSRQTLILYDKNGLLKPVKVGENGYRYYSVDQIPRLRLICLLKEMGVPLAEVRTFLDGCSVDAMRALLASRRDAIGHERDRLSRQLEELEQLDALFVDVPAREGSVGVPYLAELPERKALFVAYPSGAMDEKRLHLTLMDAWGQLLETGMFPSRGFGSLLRAEALVSDNPLAGAGSIVILPRDLPVEGAQVVTLPAGRYACMYKQSMPYDVAPARELLAWMTGQGLRAAGPVADRCLLDSVFYDDARTADFCRLEVLLA